MWKPTTLVRELALRGLRETVERRLALPGPHVAVVAVGGATFGGSGKTPLAVACTEELAAAGVAATLVGHAYRAAPGRARFVAATDDLADVGDEALVAARSLACTTARVVVAPSRSSAIAFAASSSRAIVVDGVAQMRPRRASLALLSVDGAEPWGESGRGALGAATARAPVSMLAAACDAVVPFVDEALDALSDASSPRSLAARFAPLGRPVWAATTRSRGAWVGDSLLTWDEIRRARVGLVLAMGRPGRLLRALAARGVVPAAVVCARNHGPIGHGARRRVDRLVRAQGVELWIATPKCAVHARPILPHIAILDHTVALAPELRTALRALSAP